MPYGGSEALDKKFHQDLWYGKDYDRSVFARAGDTTQMQAEKNRKLLPADSNVVAITDAKCSDDDTDDNLGLKVGTKSPLWTLGMDYRELRHA